MYILFTKTIPFFGKCDQDTIRIRINKSINASKEAKDLLNALFTVDPDSRPTAQEVLEYPWFKPLNESSPVIQAYASSRQESSNDEDVEEAAEGI